MVIYFNGKYQNNAYFLSPMLLVSPYYNNKDKCSSLFGFFVSDKENKGLKTPITGLNYIKHFSHKFTHSFCKLVYLLKKDS